MKLRRQVNLSTGYLPECVRNTQLFKKRGAVVSGKFP